MPNFTDKKFEDFKLQNIYEGNQRSNTVSNFLNRNNNYVINELDEKTSENPQLNSRNINLNKNKFDIAAPKYEKKNNLLNNDDVY